MDLTKPASSVSSQVNEFNPPVKINFYKVHITDHDNHTFPTFKKVTAFTVVHITSSSRFPDL
ncbi:hypothetical protein CY34DRAFT_798820 [Suillus luteus UH-Slu-Lm8-n1]|uniref:Uncharacterized protein n=1 Tax=Suillus luteus UH-Slu-Lm8-n1 TaxID=930992 RepID=A0A0D0BQM1_9AGAM|nr:hypothetical protein CY34DRAFT_798820 [Suillus luteus UH-Slu-Lm8-n1]